MSARDTRAGGAYVEVYAKTSKAERAMKRMANRMRAFGNQVKSIGRNMVMGGTLAMAGLVPVVSTLSTFQDKVSAVKAVTGATAGEMDKLTAKAKELGATTSFSASQVAEAMQFLGMAGFDTGQILESIPDVLNLARAGMIELGPAADIVSDVGSAFGLTAEEIGRVSDVMAMTATSSNTSIEMLGDTFKYAAPLAAAAGQEIEMTAAAAGILGNNGIKATMAGTDLALIMKKLADPSARKAIEALGVQVVDAKGNIRPLVGIMQDLDRAIAGMTSADQLAFMAKTFGRAAKSAEILSSQSKQFRELEAKLQGYAGAAAAMAKTMDDNVGGKLRNLMSALEGSMIKLGEALTPVLEPLIKDVTEFLNVSIDWISQNEELIQDLVVIIGKVTALGAAIYVAGAAISAIGTLISGFSAVMAGFRVIVSGSTAALTGFSLVLGGLAIAALVMTVGQLSDELSGLNNELERSDRLSNRLSRRKQKERMKSVEKGRSIEDPEKRRAFFQAELKKAEAEAAAAARTVESAKKEVSKKGTVYNRATGLIMKGDLAVARQDLSQANRRLREARDHLDFLRDEINKIKAGGNGKKVISGGTATDPSVPDIPVFDEKKFNQQSFVDQVLGDIETPAEKFNKFVDKLSAALERGDITNSQYDRAYELKKSQLLNPQKNEKQRSLELFADQVKDQTRTPLEEFKQRMQQLNEAVKQGLVDKKTANKFRNEESKLLVKSLGLEERKTETANRANRAVELGSSAGLNAIVSAAFRPKSIEEKQVKHLAALLVKMSAGNASLNKIVTYLQNSAVIKETNWQGGKA